MILLGGDRLYDLTIITMTIVTIPKFDNMQYAKLICNNLITEKKNNNKITMSLLPMKKIFGIFAVNQLKKQISKVFIIRSQR